MPNKIQYYKNLCENLQKKIKLIESFDINRIPPERIDNFDMNLLAGAINWLNTTFGNPPPGKGLGNLPVEGYPITKHYVDTMGRPVDFPCVMCRPVDGADPRYYPGIDQPNQPRPQLPDRGSGLLVPDIERAPTPETPGKNKPAKPTPTSIFDTDRPWTNNPDPLDRPLDVPDWSVWYDKKRR